MVGILLLPEGQPLLVGQQRAAGDLVPAVPWLHLPITTGYDRYPELLIDEKSILLNDLADRYDTTADKIDELLKRVDIVPPSMAIAQGGVESGWGTSVAARVGNSLFGQIQSVGRHSVAVPWRPGSGMPQPFSNVGEAAEAYVINLNTHPAYSAFRNERAAMRKRVPHILVTTPESLYVLLGSE
mgnify:CR=1 FL=1